MGRIARSIGAAWVMAAACLCQAATAPTAQAQAQEFPTFDCRELLRDVGFSEAVRSPKPDFVLSFDVPEGVRLDANDPVLAIELLDDGRPLLMRQHPMDITADDKTNAKASGSSLGCALIVVEIVSAAYKTPLGRKSVLTPDNKDVASARVPILIVNTTQWRRQDKVQFENWQEGGFSIVLRRDPLYDRSEGINIDVRKLGRLRYTSRYKWTSDHIVVTSINSPSENVRSFLEKANADGINELLVLCGEIECRHSAAFELDDAKTNSVQVEGTDATADNQGVTLPDAAPEVSQPDAAAGKEAQPSGTETATQTSDPPKAADKDTAFSETVDMYWAGDSKAPIDQVGGLACILSALKADIFTAEPECEGDVFEALRKQMVKVTLEDDGVWRLGLAAKSTSPERIEVTLPVGQTTSGCQMDIRIMSDTGPLLLVMNPIRGTSPPRYTTTTLAGALKPIDGRARFRIVPGDPAQCGGPARDVDMAAADILSAPLLENERAAQAVVYVVLSHTDALTDDLGLSARGAELFAGSILGAVEGAHLRVARLWKDRPWSLVNASLGRLQDIGEVKTLVTLNADALRRPDDARARFDQARDVALLEISTSTPVVDATRVADALRPIVQEAKRQNYAHLTLALIGAIKPPDATGQISPCDTLGYGDLPTLLSTQDGPTVDIFAAPLAPIDEDYPLDTTRLSPLSPSAGWQPGPGGVYACQDRSGSGRAQVYPFFVESWRSPVELPFRYGAMLSDRLTLMLTEIVSGATP